MRTIEQVKKEIENLELDISESKAKIDNFEYSLTDSEFDECLDEDGVQHTSVGSFYPSDILKNCDPILYYCAKADYEANFDLADCAEYTERLEDLESLQDDLDYLEYELKDLESEAE